MSLPSPSRPNKRNKNRTVSESNKGSDQKSPKREFEPYLSEDEIKTGLANGLLFCGPVRVNPKNFMESYISNDDKICQDYLISSLFDRNRALNGDIVIFKIKPKEEWNDKQQTVSVVAIKQKVHSRTAVGSLSQYFVAGKKVTILNPRDRRIPRLQILPVTLPPNYEKQKKNYENTIFSAKLLEWPDTHNATGAIIEILGDNNSLSVQTAAILAENDIDVTPFPDTINKYLPQSSAIPKSEYKYREDLRKECIFSIDPLTARDLDDAVSCKRLENGNYEIGVHIADVAFHLEEDTQLDLLVSKRATSVYLVERVYHMLPVELTMHCSLLPGKDQLAFSVIWEMDENGEILKERFCRSLINSCAQLAYEHAQTMIDNPKARQGFPDIHNGYNLDDISRIVNELNRLATKLRTNRFDQGALKINRVKYGFTLNSSGQPCDYHIEERGLAHFLIEEFMILANARVAEFISNKFPDIAFLRKHEAPIPRLLKDLQEILGGYGIQFEGDNSKSIRECLERYGNSNEIGGQAIYEALSHLLTKPMTRASYFCTHLCNVEDYFHYALHIPFYTHFTSPIRRYADIMVHRLLAASLGYIAKPQWQPDTVQEIASICNKQKYCAKKAGESSCELYLANYIDKLPEFKKLAVVVDVKDRSYDVVVLETGTCIRLYLNKLDDNIIYDNEVKNVTENKQVRIARVFFPKTENLPEKVQIIELFQLVKINIKRKEKSNNLEAALLHPLTEI